jgi:hypothetical protein
MAGSRDFPDFLYRFPADSDGHGRTATCFQRIQKLSAGLPPFFDKRMLFTDLVPRTLCRARVGSIRNSLVSIIKCAPPYTLRFFFNWDVLPPSIYPRPICT